MKYVDPGLGSKRAFALGATTLVVLLGLLAFVVVRRSRVESPRRWLVRFVGGAAVAFGLVAGVRGLALYRAERRSGGVRMLAWAGMSGPAENFVFFGGYILAAALLIGLGVWLAWSAYY